MTDTRQDTHLAIDAGLVGEVEQLAPGTSIVGLTTTPAMAADERGLVHGGFAFGLADYAAMVAVNDPNVVLGAADCRFLAPVRVGERMVALAAVEEVAGRKHTVSVTVRVGDRSVLAGSFSCYVLGHHVLDPS